MSVCEIIIFRLWIQRRWKVYKDEIM